jgi:hypothetical protein
MAYGVPKNRAGARAVAPRHWAVLSLAWLPACTQFEPGTDELESRGGELEAEQADRPAADSWSCLPATFEPTPYFDGRESARRLVVSVQLLNLVTEEPIAGLSVRACALRDLECVTPVSELLSVSADGWADVPLYEGFQGYLEITGETVISNILVFAAPIENAEPFAEPFGIVERLALPTLTAGIGESQSPSLGLIALRALDCEQRDASGVRYGIDKAGVPWYFVGGIPSGSATQTTDSSVGGFLNVPAGVTIVRATLTSSMRDIVGPTSVIVREGWMTSVRFLPQMP